MASRRPQYSNPLVEGYEASSSGPGQRWQQEEQPQWQQQQQYQQQWQQQQQEQYQQQWQQQQQEQYQQQWQQQQEQRYQEEEQQRRQAAMASKGYNNDDSRVEGGMASSSGPQNRQQQQQQQQGVIIGDHNGDDSLDCFSMLLIAISYLLFLVTFPFTIWSSIKIVTEYERAVIFRLGRLRRGGAAGPGWFFVLPCVDTYAKVDLRSVAFDVPPQEILTKDSVTVAVDAVVYYRVWNPTVAITNVEDFAKNTSLLAATTLRNALGTRTLSEILSQREEVSAHMQESLDEATDPWGVKVERVEIKDVRLPMQLQRAMAAEAEAAREAKAKVIAAEGENRASRALKEAADVMAESPSALQLRYLQTLNTISAEKNSTIVFPLPIDIIGPMLMRS